MSTDRFFARNLAAAFLAGPWDLEGLAERGGRACGTSGPWLRLLAQRVLAAFGDQPTAPDEEQLTRFLLADDEFVQAWENSGQEFHAYQLFWVRPAMAPAAARPGSWPVPALSSLTALAEWLNLAPGELDWFADCQGREGRLPAGPLRHYTYRWLMSRSGKARLLEVPKPRLKALQRRLVHELLERIPVHEAAHGYLRGHSVVTYTTPHVGRAIVLRLDLRQFFPSIRSSRVHALFRTAGYPVAVARRLTGLCTNVVPDEVWREQGGKDGRIFSSRHLPQGAPTSPVLANLCAYRLDCRLAGLARAVGAGYTRYADDLAFSGDGRLERCARRFQVQVCRIALEEGFEVHTRKTRFMRSGICQQLVGIVVNQRPNIRRWEYECLKAVLFNCSRHGPDSQNRDGRPNFRAYLLGRIAYVAQLNPTRGWRLRSLFDRIVWPS